MESLYTEMGWAGGKKKPFSMVTDCTRTCYKVIKKVLKEVALPQNDETMRN